MIYYKCGEYIVKIAHGKHKELIGKEIQHTYMEKYCIGPRHLSYVDSRELFPLIQIDPFVSVIINDLAESNLCDIQLARYLNICDMYRINVSVNRGAVLFFEEIDIHTDRIVFNNTTISIMNYDNDIIKHINTKYTHKLYDIYKLFGAIITMSICIMIIIASWINFFAS